MNVWGSLVHIMEIAIGVILSSVILDFVYAKEDTDEESE